MTSLLDRRPALTGEQLAQRLVPPRRFADVRFSTYRPNPEHPSQAAALADLEAFAARLSAPAPERRGWFGRRRDDRADEGRPARYLDGGFGVGKTHLLAALWHAAPQPAAYLSFAELAALVGFLGMDGAVGTFAGHRLLCIDEFELDDVANTLLAVTFLRAVVAGGTRVAATSNALPDRLGEGRFNAEDFVREIAAIASHFDLLRIDGPDYRAGSGDVEVRPLDGSAALAAAVDGLRDQGRAVTCDAFDDLLRHLRVVHPVQVGALLDGVEAVALDGVRPVDNQGDALLLVHFVDEAYDARVPLLVTGAPPDALFPGSYRHGGYRKKYGRCESRLGALLREGHVLASAATEP